MLETSFFFKLYNITVCCVTTIYIQTVCSVVIIITYCHVSLFGIILFKI